MCHFSVAAAPQLRNRLGRMTHPRHHTPVIVVLAAIIAAIGAFSERALADDLARINEVVIASLPARQGNKAEVIRDFALTHPFGTREEWTLVIAKFVGPPPAELSQTENAGPLAVCFVEGMTPHCNRAFGQDGAGESWFSIPYHLLSIQLVFAGRHPLLLMRTAGPHGGNGSHLIETQLFEYDRRSDRFESVFAHGTGSNNNQDTRFIQHGPLRGDIIVAEPTETAPYAYWISVYARNKAGQYSELALRYRSHTRYGDGNPLAVIDAEMPSLLKHFGKWKRGDPLPLPIRMPSNCTGHLFLRSGAEWCAQK